MVEISELYEKGLFSYQLVKGDPLPAIVANLKIAYFLLLMDSWQ